MEDRIRLAGLFALGAVLPLLALALMLVLGLAALATVLAWGGATALLIGIFLLGNGGLGLWLAFRSFPRSRGRRLQPGEAPELLARLEACSAAWKGPRVGEVILKPYAWGVDLIGTPVLGLLGWSRFHWEIGIYPLLALSIREFEAVAGWEVVWWSDQQGWLNLQVKRLVAFWQRLEQVLARSEGGRRGWWSALLRPYSRWLLTRLDPFLVRECLWTDTIVARQHGSATWVRCLCRLAILKTLADRRIFPEWDARLKAGVALPGDLYGDLAEGLARWPESTEGMLELALDGLIPEAPPLLRLRLLSLGAPPAVPLPPAEPAIRHLLEGTPVLRELQEAFRGRIAEHQRDRAAWQAEEDRRYRELDAAMDAGFPDHPQSAEYLRLALEREPGARFGERLETLGQVRPGDPAVGLLRLRWALATAPDSAPERMAELLRLDPFMAPEGHGRMAEAARRRGDLPATERQLDLARRAEARVARALAERESASLRDPLEAHGCEAEQLRPMLAYLEGLPWLDEAFLVRKTVRVHPERPVLLLVLRRRGGWLDLRGRRRRAQQAEVALDCPFPPEATGFVLVAGPGPLWGRRARLRRLGALRDYRAHSG